MKKRNLWKKKNNSDNDDIDMIELGLLNRSSEDSGIVDYCKENGNQYVSQAFRKKMQHHFS